MKGNVRGSTQGQQGNFIQTRVQWAGSFFRKYSDWGVALTTPPSI